MLEAISLVVFNDIDGADLMRWFDQWADYTYLKIKIKTKTKNEQILNAKLRNKHVRIMVKVLIRM